MYKFRQDIDFGQHPVGRVEIAAELEAHGLLLMSVKFCWIIIHTMNPAVFMAPGSLDKVFVFT
jgi:hypothetical protein